MGGLMDEPVRQFLFWVVTGGVGVAFGWLLRIETRAQRQEGQIAELRLHVAENYASSAELKEVSNKLDQALAILNRLQGRQDAIGG